MPIMDPHLVLGTAITPPFKAPTEVIYFALGCFWGAERIMWRQSGVRVTAVGYMGGLTPNPTYEEVCSGATGHAEAVMVAFDPTSVSLKTLLKHFWEGHDPTQGMRQGNDMGTQYRSAVYFTHEAQLPTIETSRDAFQSALQDAGYGTITTKIARAGPFYYAETYHQQYLERVPGGYCGLGGTGVKLDNFAPFSPERVD